MIALKSIIAVVFPPIACCIWGTKRDMHMSWLLTALFYAPGSIHALRVIARAPHLDEAPTDTSLAIDRARNWIAGSRAGN